jgi:hypothetical protein
VAVSSALIPLRRSVAVVLALNRIDARPVVHVRACIVGRSQHNIRIDARMCCRNMASALSEHGHQLPR